jgi:GLPGLI family protein
MNLSKIKVIIGLLFFSFLTSYAQKDFQGKAYYESKTTIDMSNFGGGQLSEERKKEIAARMKSALEKSYILTFNQLESIYKEEEKLDAPGQGGGMRFGMMNFTGGDQYKNVKDQQLLQESEVFGKQFLITDRLPKLQWELGSETKTIGQYTCFKATAVKEVSSFDIANFRGPRPRQEDNEKPKDSTKTNSEDVKEMPKQIVVTAWYTPQIPVNQGPGEYWGLPGLILEVSADRTTILCSKIVLNPSEKDEIKAPSKGKKVSKTEYDAIAKQKMEEMREMYRSRRGSGRGPRN